MPDNLCWIHILSNGLMLLPMSIHQCHLLNALVWVLLWVAIQQGKSRHEFSNTFHLLSNILKTTSCHDANFVITGDTATCDDKVGIKMRSLGFQCSYSTAYIFTKQRFMCEPKDSNLDVFSQTAKFWFSKYNSIFALAPCSCSNDWYI